MSWAEFRDLLTGLLATDESRLYRATRPPEPEPALPMYGDAPQMFDD